MSGPPGGLRWEHTPPSHRHAHADRAHHDRKEVAMAVPTHDLIREAAVGSAEGRLNFGQVVGLMVVAGVDAYSVDYRARRTTYYPRSAEPLDLALDIPDVPIAEAFDAAALRAAIAGAQRGHVPYPQFKRLSMLAGCIGYTVWIAGRHVTYYGRRGETHVEQFPD